MKGRTLLFVVVGSVIIAATLFIVINFLSSPGDEAIVPEGTIVRERNVGGTIVTFPNIDPAQEVVLVAAAPPAVIVEPDPVQPAEQNPDPAVDPNAGQTEQPAEVQNPDPVDPNAGQTEQPAEVIQNPDPAVDPNAGQTEQPTAIPNVTVNGGVEPVIYVDYQVQGGDTLYSIADSFRANSRQTSVALMAVHGVDTDDLIVGDVIQVPMANPAYCTAQLAYVVLEGDNTFRIAQRYNTTKEAIQQVNGLDGNFTVYVAQVLCIP